MKKPPRRDLLAACWTTAGDVCPSTANNVSRWSLPDRIEATARAGYAGTGLWLGDLDAWRAGGGDYATLRRHLSDAGLGIIELEFLTEWFTHGSRRERSDAVRQGLFEAADAFGARQVKVIPPFLAADADPAVLVEEFAALCDQAAGHGLIVAMEMLPFSALPDLWSALAIVEEADAPNGGLLIDIWHVVRSGSAVGDVARVPARFIKAVELCDAMLAMQGSIGVDTLHHRRLCGEGEFDVPGFIAALDAAGYDGPWGVEILSDAFRTLPLEEAARRSHDTTAAQFGAAQFGAAPPGAIAASGQSR